MHRPEETTIRAAQPQDHDFVVDLMCKGLSPFYGGDHAAHANRIFSTHIAGGDDRIGFFSLMQRMLIAEVSGLPVGMIHLVLKRQSTCKISPLIVEDSYRGTRGIGTALLSHAEQFAKHAECRQLYCTVSERNGAALQFFLRKGFIIAGRSKGQYLAGCDEYMLYKTIFELLGDDEFDIDHISVLPLEERHKEQVRAILLDALPDDFIGIDESWIQSLFTGYERRYQKDVDQKYKLIFTATDRNNRVLGVAGATPKKGEPIKLMPFVAPESPAFFALLTDVPALLREYGRKVYVHLIPDSEQTRFLQRSGWDLDGVLPDAYQVERVTQQWSKDIDGDALMRQMRLKKKYLDLIRMGRKTLEVRVEYDSLKDIKPGDTVAFLSRDDRLIRQVADVRRYRSFDDMLAKEDYQEIVPDMTFEEVKLLLQEIYPPNKEKLGVLVFQVE